VCLVDDASVQEARGQTPDGVSVISKTRVKSASLDHRSVLTETKNWCSLLPECSRLERSLEAHTECRRGRAGAQRQKRGKLKLRRPKRWWLSAAESSSERKAPTEPTEPSVSSFLPPPHNPGDTPSRSCDRGRHIIGHKVPCTDIRLKSPRSSRGSTHRTNITCQ
jgi:hypothetical protein